MNAAITFGRLEAMEERELASERIVKYVASAEEMRRSPWLSPLNELVHHTEQIGGMNAHLFNDFLAQARQNLNPDDHVICTSDGI